LGNEFEVSRGFEVLVAEGLAFFEEVAGDALTLPGRVESFNLINLLVFFGQRRRRGGEGREEETHLARSRSPSDNSCVKASP